MSVSYIGDVVATGASTSFTIASHASTKAGDLMVLMANIGGATGITSITGGSSPTWSQWIVIRTSNALSNLVVFTARAVAADIGATFTVTPSVSTQANACLATYRSTINTPTLANIQSIIDNAGSTFAITSPSWDNSAGGIGVAFASANTFLTTMTCTDTGANWTEIGDHNNSTFIATDYANDTVSSGSSNAGCTFTWTKVSAARAAITFNVVDGPVTPLVVTASSNNAASSTALGVAYPASIVAGDLLIAVICNVSTSSAIVHPLGWTALSNPAGAIASAIRLADGTESGGAATWNWTGASASVGTIVRITGANFNGLDAFNAQANASSANLTAPAITPKFNACMLLNVYCDIGANAITVPASQTAVGSSVGNSRSIVCGYEPLPSNASTGTRVATATAAVNYGFSFALAGPPLAVLELPDSIVGSLNGVQAYRDSTIPVGPVPQAIGAGGQFFGRDPYTGFPGNVFQGFGGVASISGICKVGTAPLANIWVYLSPMSSQGTVVGAVYTGDDGTFSFTGIAPGPYVIEGVDPSGTYNGQIYEEVVAY